MARKNLTELKGEELNKELERLHEKAEVVNTQKVNIMERCEKNIIELQRQTEGIASAIAGNLAVIKDKELYKEAGYKNFGDYCEDKFEISKATASEASGTFKRFGIINDDGTFQLVDKYADFAFSTLIAMKNLTEEEIKALGINSTMTRATVKKLIKDKDTAIADKKAADSAREQVAKLATALGAFEDKETVSNFIKDQVPDFFDKAVQQSKDVMENLKEELELKLDRYNNPVEAEPGVFPTRTIKVSEYHTASGEVMKEKFLREMWKLVQRANKGEFNIVIEAYTEPTEADTTTEDNKAE